MVSTKDILHNFKRFLLISSKEVALESLKKDGLKGLWGSLVKMGNLIFVVVIV